MKTETLKFTKNELGIMIMALEALFVMERREDHSNEYWRTFDDLQFKIVDARESIGK